METEIFPNEIELRIKAEERANVLRLLRILDDKKASDIIAIDVADKTIVADWFVICSGASVLQVKAICDEVLDRYEEIGLTLRRKEGYTEGRWIVLDFGYVLLHIFYPEEREYYNIERLWTDGAAEVIKYPLD
ncbi:MAG: ribosome silencing factor [Clostridia bacterium]|nr:ribosome silencing factor [Clostridia bacterium]MBQ2518365.1 ribosome silencing factor [Clostridia bacterium]MBQ4341012.1 ribosome silencing factor [Clostridia bacterium]